MLADVTPQSVGGGSFEADDENAAPEDTQPKNIALVAKRFYFVLRAKRTGTGGRSNDVYFTHRT